MGLQRRETLVEMFSTFIKIRDSQSLDGEWIFSPSLQKSMECRIQEDPEGNEDYWAWFWLKLVLENPQNSLAQGHLSAYLEEVCHEISIKDTNFQYILKIHNISKEDGFQIVRYMAAQPDIFNKYKSERGKVKNYAQKCISGKAKDKIRQGREEERHSDTGLLRRTSKTRFIKILKRAGIQDPNFSEWLLALSCFQEIYTCQTPRGCQTLPFPDAEKLAEIAEYYNQRRPSNLNAISDEDIKKMLKDCQKIIREYSSIKLVNFEENFNFEVQADISYGSAPLQPSDFKIEKQQEINSVLLKAFEKLKSEERKILQLSLGLNLTQSEIGKILNILQPQVSRKMRSFKLKAPLLTALAKWSKKELKIELKSEKLDGISPELEEWLQRHCTISCNECLKNTLSQSLTSADIHILTQLYSKNLKQKFVAEELKISEIELKEKVDQIKEHLQNQLRVHVEKRLKVSLKPCPSARKKIAAFVETWLENAPYATFK